MPADHDLALASVAASVTKVARKPNNNRIATLNGRVTYAVKPRHIIETSKPAAPGERYCEGLGKGGQ